MNEILVITPTYNREYLLPRTIESVLSQSFNDFIYIIINNGSTDNTYNILNSYSKFDNRIGVITKESNDSKLMLFVKDIIKTYDLPFYFIIDDDDFMETEAIKTLYNMITSGGGADIAAVGSRFVYPDGSMKDKYVYNGTFHLSRIEAMYELLKREKINSAKGGKLYRKAMMENTYFPETNNIRDIHVEYRTMNNIKSMIITGEPMFYFYRHDNNFSGLDNPAQITPEKINQHLEANAIRTEWLTEKMPEIKDYVFYSELSFMASLYEKIHRLEVQPCYYIANEMKTTLLRHSTFLFECGFCTEKENKVLKLLLADK